MFSDPTKNLKQLGLHEGMIVADLGAGTGFYSIASAHMVPNGKVYAVEVQRDFIDTIKNKIREEHLKNIEIIWGDVEKIGGTKIKDGVVDVVIASNILFQVIHKNKFIEEVKRILKKGGRVLLVDWSDNSSSLVSKKMIIPRGEALKMFEDVGFALKRDIQTGEHHYGIILEKK